MKILFIHYTAQYGGAEKHTEMLIEQMTLKGHLCGIVTNSPLLKERIVSSARVYEYDFNDLQVGYYHFLKTIHVEEWDVVIPVKWEVSKYTCMLKNRLGCSIVCILHSVYYKEIEQERPALKNVIRMLDRYADTVVTVSEAVKESIVKSMSFTSKIKVIKNVIKGNSTNIVYDERRTTVAFIGRLSYEKGPDIFLDAIAKSKKLKDNVRFIFAGDGPLYSALEAQISESGLQNVFLKGFVNDIKSLLSESRLVVIPSRREAFSLVALEARCSGVPVVAFNTGGIKEVVINNKTGLLIDSLSPKYLCQTIEKLYYDIPRCKAMSDEAINLMKLNNDINIWANNFENVFKNSRRTDE